MGRPVSRSRLNRTVINLGGHASVAIGPKTPPIQCKIALVLKFSDLTFGVRHLTVGTTGQRTAFEILPAIRCDTPETSDMIKVNLYERSRILVDPKVQWAIAGRLLSHWGMFLLCLISISTMVRVMIRAGEAPFLESLRSALVAQTPIVVVMVILMPVFLRDSLKLSNRFAGPMYRLRTALRSQAECKQTTPIKFRDGDFWHDAAADFNIVLSQLQRLEHDNQDLRARLSHLESEQADRPVTSV